MSKKLDLESICKGLNLDLNGDIFVAINTVTLETKHIYIYIYRCVKRHY